MSVGWLKLTFGEGSMPVLMRRRLYLRPPRPGDWREWADLRLTSRSFLTPWEPVWPQEALSKTAFRQRLRRNARDWRNDKAYAFFLFKRDDDALLGGITISNLRRGVTQSASLGYWIGRPYARQGYMTEAVHGVLDFAFGPLGLHRIEAACLPHNEASRRLLQKCGFTREGRARSYLRINGAWQDHLLFAVLSTDERPDLPADENPKARTYDRVG
jgi:ribosomal-protein-alanine N-acetyltransferase